MPLQKGNPTMIRFAKALSVLSLILTVFMVIALAAIRH